ncbi:MAG: type II secretion system protein GspG [Planctomycetales bacterium]|nr:type II secretion system protein GspG [Planctomycetales bacterium]
MRNRTLLALALAAGAGGCLASDEPVERERPDFGRIAWMLTLPDKHRQCEEELENLAHALRYYELATGAFPKEEEGLEKVLALLQDRPPAPDLRDPWGRYYLYVTPGGDSYGTAGIPKTGHLVYSRGANGIDEGGRGDDQSNMP